MKVIRENECCTFSTALVHCKGSINIVVWGILFFYPLLLGSEFYVLNASMSLKLYLSLACRLQNHYSELSKELDWLSWGLLQILGVPSICTAPPCSSVVIKLRLKKLFFSFAFSKRCFHQGKPRRVDQIITLEDSCLNSGAISLYLYTSTSTSISLSPPHSSYPTPFPPPLPSLLFLLSVPYIRNWHFYWATQSNKTYYNLYTYNSLFAINLWGGYYLIPTLEIVI